MSTVHSHIRPNTFLFLRLPSDSLKLLEIKPNTIVDVGKIGSFPSNSLLGRPYYYAYEILDKLSGEAYSRLEIVPPSELNAEAVAEDATPSESREDPSTPSANGVPDGFDLVAEYGTVIMKNNRLTVDDASRQALSQQEIEELKRSAAGKHIIEKILANHSGLDEKTEFSKAKYKLRKTKKYLKRFTALPMDLGNLMEYILTKEAPRIMELRDESLGLMMAWSHAHFSGDDLRSHAQFNGDDLLSHSNSTKVGAGRWLVIDETGGLVVAAIAERMGILFREPDEDRAADTTANGHRTGDVADSNDDVTMEDAPNDEPPQEGPDFLTDTHKRNAPHTDFPYPAQSNTITLLHPAVQPNLSLLKYFGYDTNQPDPSHPLHTHLKPLSWLQLLYPQDDATYQEPESVPDHILRTWKSGKRGTYWKKRRRWERCKAIVDEARAGEFDGLVIASSMDPASILPHAVPLVRGGGHVVIYSPTSEPLVTVVDFYSRERRAGYIAQLAKGEVPDPEDFPVDPRLLLAPTLQTSRAREWQVLPGRTHPLMTSRGGSEGYVFTARKVVPLEGGVEARGNFNSRKRKAGVVEEESTAIA